MVRRPRSKSKTTSNDSQVIFGCHTKVTRSSAAEEMIWVLDEFATGYPSVSPLLATSSEKVQIF